MYGSAIFYRLDRLSPAMQKIMTIVNPLYTVIAIARECIMERIFPDWKLWVIVSVYGGGCYLVGSVYFNRKIEDIIQNTRTPVAEIPATGVLCVIYIVRPGI